MHTAYKFLNRVRTMGEAGLQDLSRRPLHSPTTIPDVVKDAVVSVRAAHPQWGGRRIAQELKVRGVSKAPAASTITTILSRRGLLHSKVSLSETKWLSAATHEPVCRKIEFSPPIDEPDLAILREHLLSKRLLERRRAVVILASRRGMRQSAICKLLHLSPTTHRRCIRLFAEVERWRCSRLAGISSEV